MSVNPRGNKKVWYDKLIANHKICIILKKMAEGEGERQKESGSFVASSKKKLVDVTKLIMKRIVDVTNLSMKIIVNVTKVIMKGKVDVTKLIMKRLVDVTK